MGVAGCLQQGRTVEVASSTGYGSLGEAAGGSSRVAVEGKGWLQIAAWRPCRKLQQECGGTVALRVMVVGYGSRAWGACSRYGGGLLVGGVDLGEGAAGG
ncbi:unnamed protein product [Dovyalis caffra]|uniref:Uncharacterized protein n=1 Tax=Dovyalis caffra TaxID=77055 RepID=A0AAV1SNG5_9ROSI|nr:unnamed protein product [Dovyalis caffra]